MRITFVALAVFAMGLALGTGIVNTSRLKKTDVTPLKLMEMPATDAELSLPPEGLSRKRVGLTAHDARKADLVEWVRRNAALLMEQELYATGTTGRLVQETLEELFPERKVDLMRFNAAPLGGDQQMGALIAGDGLDVLVYFIDPMTPSTHAADAQALFRLCAVHNTVLATTESTADFIITSPRFMEEYAATKKFDNAEFIQRKIVK